jgi:5'-phosphate synthase pdxT subunit
MGVWERCRHVGNGEPARVGVLALQGDVTEHRRALINLGATAAEVRTPEQLDDVDALILPGGESTTMSLLLESSGLAEPLAKRLEDGMPAFGTCAGMILLARDILDGRPDQRRFAAIDIGVRRNAFGRQVDSFETTLDVAGVGEAMPAVFIRAPVVEWTGPEVQVLAALDGATVDEKPARPRPVLCREGPVLVAAFHPELSGDPRLHRLFLDIVAGTA